MSLDKKRWLILAVSCLINLCIGSLYSWSVFAKPLASHLSEINGLSGQAAFTSASLSIVFMIANSVGPISMISGGFFNDKLGPRWVVVLGGILFGGGMLLTGFAKSINMVVITYGLGCGLGMGFVYICTVNNAVKFFPDKRGLIGGITTAFYGFSSVLLPPLANNIIQMVGVMSAFRIIGSIILIVIIVGAFFIQKCPDNYAPKGWQPKSTSGGGVKDYDWSHMIRDKQFYIMLFMLLCGAFSGLMIISQASSMAQNMIGVTAGVAASFVSIIALFNAVGRICAGYLSDVIGRINVLAMACILSIVGMVLLSLSGQGDQGLFIVAGVIIGLCFGTYMGVYPGFTADQFGAKNNSMNYGITFVGFALAGMSAPMSVGKIITGTGSYTMAFFVAGIISGIGFVLNLLFRKMSKA